MTPRVPGRPGPDHERIEASITGIVQGVGFRYFVRGEAQALGLEGWVANQRDGSVRLVAEGPRAALERLVERLAIGPDAAEVEDVHVRWSAAVGGFSGFGVHSGWHPGD